VKSKKEKTAHKAVNDAHPKITVMEDRFYEFDKKVSALKN